MTANPTTGLLALVGISVALFWGLGTYPLLQPDEGRNAEIAREMLASGHWLIPTYNGLPYLDKPAFFFRAVAASLAVFGPSAFAARLPSAILGLATVAIVYLFCRRVYDVRTAVLSALILGTAPIFLAFARVVIFDMTLGFFVTASILAGFLAGNSAAHAQRRWFALSAAGAGAATLVKGPVGFIVPTLVLAIYNLWSGNRGWWRAAFDWRNVCVFLLLVVPWFVGVSLHHPDFPYYGLVKESFERFTTDEFRRTAPFYYYAPVILLGLFPWSLLIPEAVHRAYARRRQLAAADRLFISWSLGVVIFFSLSQSKLPGYILTAVVALAVLLARAVTPALAVGSSAARKMLMTRGAMVYAVCASLLACVALVPLLSPDWIAIRLPRQAPYLLMLVVPLSCLGLLFAATAIGSAVAFIRRDARLVTATFAVFSVVLVPILVSGMKPYAEHRSARALHERLLEVPNDATLVCYRCYPNGWSFYSNRYVTIVTASEGYELQSNYIRFALRRTDAWPDTMVRELDFERWLDSLRTPAMVLAKAQDVERLQPILNRRAAVMRPLTEEFFGVLVLPKRI